MIVTGMASWRHSFSSDKNTIYKKIQYIPPGHIIDNPQPHNVIPFMQYHTVSIWNVYSIHIMCRCNHAWMFVSYHDNALMDTLRPTRNRQYFADDIFKRIFFNESVWILINISLKFVPKGPINNFPVLVQMMMAWRRSGDKTLSEPIMISLPTHICVTWPQSVKWGWRKKLHTYFHQKFHVAFYS